LREKFNLELLDFELDVCFYCSLIFLNSHFPQRVSLVVYARIKNNEENGNKKFNTRPKGIGFF